MLRCGEDNHHVHSSYAEETAPSSNVNYTGEDVSKEIIVHKTLSENIYMDVSESECNIVNETLSQNNSSDVQTNVITELKYDEHIEPSVSDKRSSYFNIFECGRNILDQLDFMYQRAFIASSIPSLVPKGHYEPSPARDRFYDICADHIAENNDGIEKDELRKAVAYMKSENEEEHERNIKDMIQDDDYNSPWENKDAKVATGLRTITYSSDPDKKPAARKEPIKGSHPGKRVRHSIDGTSCHRTRFNWARSTSGY